MLASALTGRTIEVKPTSGGQATWTDGKVIYIEHALSRQMQLAQICCQSALLAAGSLDRSIIKQLTSKPALTQRYLAVEGHRALAQIERFLPQSILSLLTYDKIGVTTSALESLDIASNRRIIIDEPPIVFGTIRPRQLLAAQLQRGEAISAGRHAPRNHEKKQLKELPDQATGDDEAGADHSSPVGGGGAIGKLLQKMFNMVRNVKGGGSPGADAATHWSRTGTRAKARAVQSSASAETVADIFRGHTAISYPEWNMHTQCYRMDWCTVQLITPTIEEYATVDWLEGYGLRKPITRLSMGLDRCHRQRQGDDIDIDALIESRVNQAAGAMPDDGCYVESQHRRRDLSVLVLLDISGSVTQASVNGSSVHEQQRSVSAALITVLHEVGDRVALYAFHSQGRSAIHLTPIKRFDENLDSQVMNRLYSLKPGAYSRLGAAIRHGTTEIIQHGSTARKLLVVLSDGLAYDHGYEPHYAAADVRKALVEARRDGVGCVCLSVGADTETEALRRVFGSAAHALIPDPRQLGQKIGPLFRTALQTAESQRRIA